MINENISLNKEKFKQVLHHIISSVGSLENVGKTVIYKMLYFSDFDNYELKEVSLTGERYVKLPMGPAPRDFDGAIKELKKEKRIKEFDTTYGKHKQIKFSSLCKPNLNLLNAEEIGIVDKVINKLSNMTATQVSGYSHEDMPWKATENMKEIDYELVFYRTPTFSVSSQNNY